MTIWTYTKFHLDANQNMIKLPNQYHQ